MCLSDFERKDVISAKDCKKLGRVCDLVFDERDGSICKLIVKEKSGICGFLGLGEEVEVCYQKICQIGPDIILVEI